MTAVSSTENGVGFTHFLENIETSPSTMGHNIIRFTSVVRLPRTPDGMLRDIDFG